MYIPPLQNGVRENANVSFYTALDIIFAVKKYAQELFKIIDKRDIKVLISNTK